jgi:hypothetical protein
MQSVSVQNILQGSFENFMRIISVEQMKPSLKLLDNAREFSLYLASLVSWHSESEF